MDLTKLDVVKAANKGSILYLLHPIDNTVLNDLTEEEEEEIKRINTDKSLTEKQRENALLKIRKPKDWYVRLLGNDSDVYRSGIKRMAGRNQNKKTDIDKAVLESAQLLAKCTTDCYITENEKPVPYNRDELTRLYLNFPWMREQVEEYMKERSNLTLGSVKA